MVTPEVLNMMGMCGLIDLLIYIYDRMGILCFSVSHTFQYMFNKMGILIMGILENHSNGVQSNVFYKYDIYVYRT